MHEQVREGVVDLVAGHVDSTIDQPRHGQIGMPAGIDIGEGESSGGLVRWACLSISLLTVLSLDILESDSVSCWCFLFHSSHPESQTLLHSRQQEGKSRSDS